MRRERKEIFKKIEELSKAQESDLALGYGNCSYEISQAYEPEYNMLHEKLAATYGIPYDEYFDIQCQIGSMVQMQLYEQGVIPFY
jgi:lysophospholipase L1-like esterase